ncbi:MAG: YbfB/YjiJ family MFS transporter, partial [Desulfuromonadales bacterium]|nr:YbfB/YjiJ family MFS transporter [Desulfuromonadales bacterium]
MSDRPNNYETRQNDRSVLYILVGGMLGLVVAMGIGRFAFTPILPLMQRDLAMSNTVAGWLAGLNYLGYLAGAVLCSISPQVLHSRFVTGSALLLSLVTTLFMGLTVSSFWWGTMRLVGGWASAILFIVISAEVGEA